MKAKIVQLQQGTPAWDDHRAKYFNGSEASAMLGLSTYKRRDDLLKEKSTGIVPDIDARTQALFDRGHQIEEVTKPLAEAIIGADLFPLVLAAHVFDMPMSSSLDGCTMDESTTWENKSLNDNLRGSLALGKIPEEYWPQMEQGLMLTGASRCLFTASDGRKETLLYAWYEKNLEVRKRLIEGWKQFEEDLKSYEYVEPAIAVVGNAPDQLPALRIQVTGMVQNNNVAEFRAHAVMVFDGIKTDLKTDQDFADAEKTVKFCRDVEGKIELAKDAALAQTASIDDLFRALDDIKETSRQKRLSLEKLVKSKKEGIKINLVNAASGMFQDHIRKLNERLREVYMPPIDAGFPEAIRGLKSIESMNDKLDTAFRDAKLAANEMADQMEANLNLVYKNDYLHLVPDLQSVCTKDTDDFKGLIAVRLQTHQAQVAAEEKKKRELAALEPDLPAADENGKPLINENAPAENLILGDSSLVPGMQAIKDDLGPMDDAPGNISGDSAISAPDPDIVRINKKELPGNIGRFCEKHGLKTRARTTFTKNLMLFIDEYLE